MRPGDGGQASSSCPRSGKGAPVLALPGAGMWSRNTPAQAVSAQERIVASACPHFVPLKKFCIGLPAPLKSHFLIILNSEANFFRPVGYYPLHSKSHSSSLKSYCRVLPAFTILKNTVPFSTAKTLWSAPSQFSEGSVSVCEDMWARREGRRPSIF